MFDEEERQVYELRIQTLADSAALIVSAEEKGMEKGRKQAQKELARQLLDVLDDVTIAAKTGLAPETVAEMRREAGHK